MAEKKIPLPPPLEVSPLIKLIRWSCLIYGIVYGFTKRREYAATEKVLREKEEREKPAREAFLAREKLIRDAAEMKELEELLLGTSKPKEETTLKDELNTELNEELNTELNEELNEELDDELDIELDERD